ncbi:hypothetical protein [Nostoc sp. MS1]|uniref:hypothetical protein n=1 Tax=Nostoc sp. MS1 TaxID=2764711 RepID=UPI001CC4C1E4|nr:hypothetical protein [Nostoc sp. MS1]BCL36558.1 hypothetical protein NSMS1_30050 [Nostoc sp. MS1]
MSALTKTSDLLKDLSVEEQMKSDSESVVELSTTEQELLAGGWGGWGCRGGGWGGGGWGGWNRGWGWNGGWGRRW